MTVLPFLAITFGAAAASLLTRRNRRISAWVGIIGLLCIGLGKKTVEFMTTNHLAGGGDLGDLGMPRFGESNYQGIGFGLGFSVMLNPAKATLIGSAGEYAWSGAASTAFWIDPAEDLIVIIMTQLMPSATYPLRREPSTF